MMPGAGMMGWGMSGSGALGMGFGWLFMLIFWGLIAAAAFLGLRWLLGQRHPAPRNEATEPALEILRKRYAGGEIDREEFETKKRDLVS